jgi:hypothetical protein
MYCFEQPGERGPTTLHESDYTDAIPC